MELVRIKHRKMRSEAYPFCLDQARPCITVGVILPTRQNDGCQQKLRQLQLIRREDCCLIVIDVQTYFLGKLPLDWREPLVEKMA